VIRLTVLLYILYPLSLRKVEDLQRQKQKDAAWASQSAAD